jgi:hypothetical protein
LDRGEGDLYARALNHCRPCIRLSCRHNLALDVDEGNGSIKLNFPDREVEDIPPNQSCSLDVAAEGGVALENVAITMNVTRERIRQVEDAAIARIKRRSSFGGVAKVLAEYVDESPALTPFKRSFAGRPAVEADARDDQDDDDSAPTRISFFAEPESERAHGFVAASVWRMFARDSNHRGFDCRSRSRSSIAASKALARRRESEVPRSEEETTMTTKKDLGDRQQAVLTAYTTLRNDLGRLPTNFEIAETIGAPWANENTVRAVRNALVELGLAENRPRGGPGANYAAASTAKPRTAASAPRAAAPRVVTTPSKPTTPKPPKPAKPAKPTTPPSLVAELTAARDDLRRRADALDVAIGALS